MSKTIIKVFQDYDGALSLEDLEEASDSLIRARLCKTEVRVGFNFLQRLINEVLASRREDAELFAEIDTIWQEILDEDSDKLPRMSPEAYERTKQRLFDQIALTEPNWQSDGDAATTFKIPSADLTSSETVKMSEETTDMVQIYDPGHPSSDPDMAALYVDDGSEIEPRRPIRPMPGQRRSRVLAHNAAHKYWAEDKSTRLFVLGVLAVICTLVWLALATG